MIGLRTDVSMPKELILRHNKESPVMNLIPLHAWALHTGGRVTLLHTYWKLFHHRLVEIDLQSMAARSFSSRSKKQDTFGGNLPEVCPEKRSSDISG
ncbi:UNVERIFIED_CONTAM: hypothetical protein Sangu_2655900 [Sesamum angustifolium]|uniref:Uncharacterized protein n=1 Tax=Sesamum angustifolium TaxID=2727405 RepID=A0AAW2J215_9LAMI